MIVESYPGLGPGLLDPPADQVGGPGADLATLRGRGGAGFPFLRKAEAVRTAAGPRVAIANGEEGEPTSVKDRWLLRNRPGLVLEGLRTAARMVGADTRIVYLSDDDAAAAVREVADGERVVQVTGSYFAGEETAVVRAVGGGPALPADKPPRPFQEGKLVSNVETLAALALAGRGVAPETFLLTLSGIGEPSLFEVPFGVTLRHVLRWRDVDPDQVGAVLMGGYFAGLLGPGGLDVPLEHEALRAADSGLGCGAVVLLPQDECPVAAAAAVMGYFSRENAGQCGSCFNGTAAMRVVLEALREGRATAVEVDRLRHWSGFLPGRGACGTLDGAAALARSLLREFPALVEDHRLGPCARCAAAVRPPGPPFAVPLTEEVPV